jgi:predicted GH43/DUF377 family glycosyl hydrolase
MNAIVLRWGVEMMRYFRQPSRVTVVAAFAISRKMAPSPRYSGERVRERGKEANAGVYCRLFLGVLACSLGFARTERGFSASDGGTAGREGRPIPCVKSLAESLPCTVDFFDVDGCPAFLIRPKGEAAPAPMPWVWYAPVIGHPNLSHAWMLRQWLEKGIGMAGVDVGESCGNPRGRKVYTALWETLRTRYRMSEQPCLLPQSRGGLMLYNWAAENPTRVACVAGIYTVCDLRSYPGLDGACAAYGLSAAELADRLAEHNPIDRLAPLAQANVPILHVHGDSDKVVPLEKNAGELTRRYRALGGEARLIVVPGKGHQVCPEFFECQALVDFVAAQASRTSWSLGPFVKREQPVLEPNPQAVFRCPVSGKTVHWEAQNVYNPAAVVKDGKVCLLYRADDEPRQGGWGRTCRIGLATSSDGRSFTRSPQPVIYPDNDSWKQYEWEGGCEDIHIIEDEQGKYYVNYTAWSGTADAMCVATSKDLVHWTKHGPAFAKAHGGKFVRGSRSGVVVCRREGDRLVAAKIDGKYWMYWKIGCFLATSEDLIAWTPVVDERGQLASPLPPRPGRFDSSCCEAGAIALRTRQGIRLMYNGENRKHEQGGDRAYPAGWAGLGQALLAANQPVRLLDRLDRPFVHAEFDWELRGFTPPAVVANGMVWFRGEWLLYYGAADRRIGLAVCRQTRSE